MRGGAWQGGLFPLLNFFVVGGGDFLCLSLGVYVRDGGIRKCVVGCSGWSPGGMIWGLD